MYHYFIDGKRVETEYKSLNEAIIKEDNKIDGNYSLLVTKAGPIPKEFYMNTNDSIGFTYGDIYLCSVPPGVGGGCYVEMDTTVKYEEPIPTGYMIEPNEGPDWMHRVNPV